MFTALSMIVLAFFIVLNALATINNLKVKKALASLYGSFGPLSGGNSIEAKKILRVHEKTAEKQQVKAKNYRSFLSRQDLDPGIDSSKEMIVSRWRSEMIYSFTQASRR